MSVLRRYCLAYYVDIGERIVSILVETTARIEIDYSPNSFTPQECRYRCRKCIGGSSSLFLIHIYTLLTFCLFRRLLPRVHRQLLVLDVTQPGIQAVSLCHLRKKRERERDGAFEDQLVESMT